MKLTDLRHGDEKWRISVLDGPALTRELAVIDDFDGLLTDWAEQLGIEVEHVSSNYEGRLLEHIHGSAPTTHGYLVNPGGLTTTGESLRHALRDCKRPHVEVHLDKTAFDSPRSILAPSVTGIVSGMAELSYLGALISLVLSLDDEDFLAPTGQSEINRSDGGPRPLSGR